MFQKLLLILFFLNCVKAYAQVQFTKNEEIILSQIYQNKIQSGEISSKISYKDYIQQEAAITMQVFRSNKKETINNMDPFHRLQMYGDMPKFEISNGEYFLTALDYNSRSPFPLHVQFGRMENDQKFKSANRMPFRAEYIIVRSVKIDGKIGLIFSAAMPENSTALDNQTSKLIELYIEFNSELVPEVKSLSFFDPYLESNKLRASIQALYTINLFKVFQHHSLVEIWGSKYRTTGSKVKMDNQTEILKDLERTLLPGSQRTQSLLTKPKCQNSANSNTKVNQVLNSFKTGRKF